MFFSQNNNYTPTKVRDKKLPTFFGENFWASYDDQRINNATLSLEYNFYDAYEENLNNIKKLTGEDFQGIVNVSAFLDIAKNIEGRENEVGYIRQKTLDRIEKQNEKLKELKKQYPEIKTIEEVWDSVKQNSKEVEENASEIASSATFRGGLGNFAGAMVGSFTVRDPFNLGTLFVGGFGRTIAQKVLTEAGAQSSIETMNEFFGVRENRDLLGLDNSWGRTAGNIAFAGFGGGLVRGAQETIPLAYRGLSNSEYLNLLKEKVKKPNKTAQLAMDVLDREIKFYDEANPFTKDFEGSMEHLERMKNAEEFLERGSLDSLERLNKTPLRTEEELNIELNKINEEVYNYLETAKGIKSELQRVGKIDFNEPKTLKDGLGYVPDTLNDFIRKTGGIADYAGELESRGVTKSSTYAPFTKSLVTTEKMKQSTLQGTFEVDNQINSVKQRVFDEGFFPEKNSYDEITDDELYDAIAEDAFGKRLYKSEDNEKLISVFGKDNIASKYDELGITPDMSVEDIARALRDEDIYKNFDEIDAQYRKTAQENYQQEMAVQESNFLKEYETYAETAIDRQIQDIKELSIDDDLFAVGSFLNDEGKIELMYKSAREMLEEIEEDDALVKAAKECAI